MSTRVDGRKEMQRNPKPKKYFVVYEKKTGKPIEAFRESDITLSERLEYRNHPKHKLEAVYYANDKEFERDTGLMFPSDEVDN